MWLKDDATNELVLHGWTGSHHRQGDRFRIGIDGIVGQVGLTRGPTTLPTYGRSKLPARRRGQPIRARIPLLVGGRLVGVFDVEHTDSDAFSPARIQLLEALAGHVAVAIENARLFRQERLEKERMAAELLEARRIQLGLLPSGSQSAGICIDADASPRVRWEAIGSITSRWPMGGWASSWPSLGQGPGRRPPDVVRAQHATVAGRRESAGRDPRPAQSLLVKDLPASRFVTMVYGSSIPRADVSSSRTPAIPIRCSWTTAAPVSGDRVGPSAGHPRRRVRGARGPAARRKPPHPLFGRPVGGAEPRG